MLSEVLTASPIANAFPDLLVGRESHDDAAVYRLSDTQAIVATTDFFMPIVDDPYDFGRIAAANAISDVYAMGARPFMALALLGMPVGKVSTDTIRRILAGGEAMCGQAGIPVAGGHSIDTPEPIYGLVALGLVHPDEVKRNDRARAGDVLILGKPLGIGILSAALKKGELAPEGYRQMIDTAARLNTPGYALARHPEVHALTDVTGFGLLGHLLEICRGSGVRARIASGDVPLLPAAAELAARGVATGASDRNWASYADAVSLSAGLPEWQKKLLTDPQTSGGLLVACSPQAADEVLTVFRNDGFEAARVIGHLVAGPAGIDVAG